MFRSGLTDFEPRQWCDSPCSVPPFGEVSYHILQHLHPIPNYPPSSYRPSSSTIDQPSPPRTGAPHPPLPPFQARPPLTYAQARINKRDSRKQRFLRLSMRFPPTNSNPRCARFRIWQSDVRQRRRQLKVINDLSQQITRMVKIQEQHIALFAMAAAQHSISVERNGEVLSRPLKRKRSPSPSPTATLHIAPLRRGSSFNQHRIASVLRRTPKYRRQSKT